VGALVSPRHDDEKHAARYRVLARRILAAAEEGRPRERFIGRALRLLLDAAGAARIVLRVREHGEEVVRTLEADGTTVQARREPTPPSAPDASDAGWRRALDPEGAFTTRLGSVFASGDTLVALTARAEGTLPPHLQGIGASGAASIAWIPLAVSADPRAALVLVRDRGQSFDRHATRLYEALAQILVVALDQQSARWALAERIKELTCLYEIARVAGDRELALHDALDRMAATLPPAMQHPAAATARIVVDGASHATPNFREGPHRLVADVVAHGVKRGVVEVFYRDDVEGDGEPFLREEHALLGAIAGEAGRLVERERATSERARLEEQLRHADRLATIGTLAAGVAHELNEPLGSVLGLAQLAAKTEGLPPPAAADLQKIVRASLHAREIVRKLMLFARHEPPRKTVVRLESVVGDALDLLAARCAQCGVVVERDFAEGLPEIVADAAQMRQVVVNLAVNAIQAMPAGGKLLVRIAAEGDVVYVEVVDDGAGMDEATRRRIFTPFFTTKDVGEGTGLGLAVVHGIVASHGGTIEVESAPGRGSRFCVRLPSGRGDASEVPGT
jgi:signal transduction histidine kinase